MWELEFTAEFEAWWATLTPAEQQSLVGSFNVLRELGPVLSRPYADVIHGSRHANLKELRTQHRGRPLRTFFAFDPRRIAILLTGGDKTGDGRFYERMVPVADRLFDEHVAELRKKGLI